MNQNPNRARDHLANERTFLAWVRTGAAIVVFGFAIGRFSIAIRQLTAMHGHPARTTGLSVWMGTSAIVAGVALVMRGCFVIVERERCWILASSSQPDSYSTC